MRINAYREQRLRDKLNLTGSNYCCQMPRSEPEGLHLLFDTEEVSPYTGPVQGLQSLAKHLASGLG